MSSQAAWTHLLSTFQRHGPDAAEQALRDYIEQAPAGPKAAIREHWARLALWTEVLKFRAAWRLTIMAWCAVIRGFESIGDREKAAYFFNELGIFLFDAGDDRCIGYFIRACALARSPGRKMRTLGRIGDAHCLLRKDWGGAEKFYRAAIIVGDGRGVNPLHVQQARFRLRDLEADRRGESEEFDKLRKGMARVGRNLRAVLRHMEVPAL